jgi:hypothetical protein
MLGCVERKAVASEGVIHIIFEEKTKTERQRDS